MQYCSNTHKCTSCKLNNTSCTQHSLLYLAVFLVKNNCNTKRATSQVDKRNYYIHNNNFYIKAIIIIIKLKEQHHQFIITINHSFLHVIIDFYHKSLHIYYNICCFTHITFITLQVLLFLDIFQDKLDLICLDHQQQ